MPAKAATMDKENQSAVDSFFENLNKEDQQAADIFDENKGGDAAAAVVETEAGKAPEKDDEPRKNRRHRRLEKQLGEEREARIRAEALAAARSERPQSSDTSIDERLVRLYGPENEEAQRLHMELLRDFSARGKDEALKEMEQRQDAARKEQQQFERLIDDELESIEEEFNVDVTSDAPAARKARRELLELVQKLSPKDQSGTITAYADFHETWELYQARRDKPAETATRAKEIAARTMAPSGTGKAEAKQPTPGFRGWMRDFNVNS